MECKSLNTVREVLAPGVGGWSGGGDLAWRVRA